MEAENKSGFKVPEKFKRNEKTELQKKEDKLRFIERQFERVLDPWHFEMLAYFSEPIQIYSWFKNAVKEDDTISLDGNTTSGQCAYRWIEDHYKKNLVSAFGKKIEVALVSSGRAIRKFKCYDPKD